jgi:hypothetical protein
MPMTHAVRWRGSVKPLMVLLWCSAKPKWWVCVTAKFLKRGWFAVEAVTPAWLAIETMINSMRVVQITIEGLLPMDCDHNHWVHGEMGGSGSGDLDLEQKGLGQALSSDDSLRFGLGLDSAQSEMGQGLGWSLLGPCVVHVSTHGSTHDGLQKPRLLQHVLCENRVG